MTLESLIHLYADGLRAMDHKDYAALVASAGCSGPAAESAVRRARENPETRVNNVINIRVFRYIHEMETGDTSGCDRSGLQLF